MRLISRTLALVGLLVAAMAVGAAPAHAKECWERLIDDWYDGRIDKVYPVKCYQQAIDNAPEEAETYTSLPEDLRRALAGVVRSNGNGGTKTGGVAGTNTTTVAREDEANPNAKVPAGARGRDTRDAAAGGGDDSPFGDAFQPASADSVPLPLIIMAALALLLMAGGAAGMISRRMQTRRVPITPPQEQPPA